MKSDDSSFFHRRGQRVRNSAAGRGSFGGHQTVPCKPHPGTSESGSDERLNSWKEIAAFMRRSVHSVRHWEKEEGLPVHRRQVRCRGKTVYAFKKELCDWWITDPSMERASDGWMDSWKEIAVYLRRSVRSARRWEKAKGLPVHRHFHAKGGSVYAYREDLDAWRNSQGSETERSERPPALRFRRRRSPSSLEYGD